jgi:signal recognition particle subunit SRP19
MPSHPQIEEVEDSDIEVSDPSEDDIDDFDDDDIIRRVDPKQPSPAAATALAKSSATPAASSSSSLPFRPGPDGGPAIRTTTDASAYKAFQCLYPVYFDAARSRAEGRRVGKELAVRNPLASEIANACGQLQLQTVFEPAKLHPKDWGNPGRVRVLLDPKNKTSTADGLNGVGGRPPVVKNKHHLYLLVAQHLQRNPTTEDGPALRFHARGGPRPPGAGEAWPKPAVPRGWKINELIPFHSPAMTGGGVSENLFKDMMSQMGGQGMIPGMEALAGGPAGKSEEKKEKKSKKDKGKGKG